MISLRLSPYHSFSFWFFLVLFVLIHQPFWWIGNKLSLRNIFMILMSCLIIWLAETDYMPQLILALLFVTIMVYYTGKHIFHREADASGSKLTLVAVVFIVFFLCYFKYSYFQSSINAIWDRLSGSLIHTKPHIFFVGISYFSFKFIHFLADCHNKRVRKLDFLTFVNYIFFFPSFFSGPINRYNSFVESLENGPASADDYKEGLKRIINGLFKKIVLANNLAPYTISSLDLTLPTTTPAAAILGVYAYMFYIYFDFSGYSDMAIGSGRLVGIKLPENFNYPFLRRNLQQFWANWHMSLTAWLTDYIYWPLARKLRHIRRLRSMPVTNSNICIIVTFMVCGLWHGDGINFFLWGLYHGIGLASLKIYSQLVNKHFPLPWKRFVHKSRVSYLLSAFVTFQYVWFGFMLFACDLEKQRRFFDLVLGW